MSGHARVPDWDLLTVEQHTDFDVTDPIPQQCTECDGDGQTGTERDGQPIVCEHCGGNGREPSPEELLRREEERYTDTFGDVWDGL